jgi:hypothetical protein
MTHSYISGAGLGKQLRRLGLTALLAGGATVAAQAQNLNYTTAGASNVTTTYTDLGTTGTAITTANNDDANSAAQNIGFTFAYNGTTFSQFVLNTNGFIKLGATAPSATAMFIPEATNAAVVNPITSVNDPNIIAPFNFDLAASPAGGTEYRVYTAGNAGSRVCTIQWKNVSDRTSTYLNQYSSMNFQVRLYEATGVVEFVYGSATQGTNPDDYRIAQTGLKGSYFGSGQLVQALTPTAATAWSAAIFGDYATVAASQRLNVFAFRGTLLPDAGRTYRFTPLTPPVANDAAVTSVFTLGKLPVPAALPHTVQAVISNPGTSALTNLAVTLNVTGANTFTNTQTIASLASGATTTVTFAAYPTTFVAGTNTVTVTVPTDGNNANNSAAVQQAVATGTGTFSYVPANLTNTSGSFVVGAPTTAGGILATKYTTQRAGTVTSVSVYLGSVAPSTTAAASVGKTVYGVVLSPTGAVLGQSPNYVIQTADLGTYKIFNITTPPTVAAGGSFLAGLAQAAYTGLPYYPVIIQDEAPTRTDTYFAVPLAGGTPVDQALNANGTNSGFGRLMSEATLSVALATSKELQRAITVYPNPSESGIFNLNVQAANAANGLGVEVTNQLGQRVYTGTARDNNTTKLDLSNLANGIYHLQVRNGQEYTSSQISIVK